jgi:hypothetical protein
MNAIINGRTVPVCGGALQYGQPVKRPSFGKMYPYTCASCGEKGHSTSKERKHCHRALKVWYECPKAVQP